MTRNDLQLSDDTPRAVVLRAFGTAGQFLAIAVIVVIVIGLGATNILRYRDLDMANDQSKNNLRQITLGIHQMVATNDSPMPPARGRYPTGGPDASIFFHILPGIEQDNIYQEYKNDPVNGPTNAVVTIKTYCAPLDPSNPAVNSILTSYGANAAVFGFNAGGSTRLSRLSAEKGTANYVLFMERFAVVGPIGIRHTWCGRGEIENYLYPTSDPAKLTAPEFGVKPIFARNDSPHSFATYRRIRVGMADGSMRSVAVGATRSFSYAEDKTATIWAWACSLDSPLAKAPMPDGW